MSVVLQGAIGIITGAIAAYLASNVALHKYYKEKWWDKKLEAFTHLINELHKINNNSEYRYNKEIYDRGGLNYFHTLDENGEKALQTQFDQGMDELKKTSHTASLYLSDKCSDEIKEYLHSIDILVERFHDAEIDSFDAYQEDYILSRNLMASIITEAKKELKAEQLRLESNAPAWALDKFMQFIKKIKNYKHTQSNTHQ
ncbi:UNVERIFIED_ORG: hypothetical protein EOZ59_0984 [Serratia quinivorans]